MDNYTPLIGMTFDNMNDAWIFWEQYGLKIGFGVRKQNLRKSRIDDIEISRIFSCSKEGRRKIDKRRGEGAKKRWETRCGCKAMMEVVLVRETMKVVVKRFIGEHNHELEPLETRHLCRSHKEVSAEQGQPSVSSHCIESSEDLDTWTARMAAKVMQNCFRIGDSPIGRQKIEAHILKLNKIVEKFSNVKSEDSPPNLNIPQQATDGAVKDTKNGCEQRDTRLSRSCLKSTRSRKLVRAEIQVSGSAPNSLQSIQLPNLQCQSTMPYIQSLKGLHVSISGPPTSQASNTSYCAQRCMPSLSNDQHQHGV
ncbi:hypothetical protein Nepgr_013112 [Nepenthes gracilis]|uniref:FAR1 domain-containing protein n=1 Tax=Nepenthes gracilis TaxID=150966 RepID=A0AAD3SIC7_NEPGR|nr:hypothetical protein Nepgr_013112 [Nepenthes gracilis]